MSRPSPPTSPSTTSASVSKAAPPTTPSTLIDDIGLCRLHRGRESIALFEAARTREEEEPARPPPEAPRSLDIFIMERLEGERGGREGGGEPEGGGSEGERKEGGRGDGSKRVRVLEG